MVTLFFAIFCSLVVGALSQDRLWTRLKGTSDPDEGYAVAADLVAGVVYVTGYVAESLHGQPFAGDYDIVLLKYSSNGTRVWTKLAGSTGSDYGFGVAVDRSTSSVYVTGGAGGSLNGQTFAGGVMDIFLMKYASEGTLLWTYSAGTSQWDEARGVVVDSSGVVYVTGTYNGEVVLMKIASNSTLIWIVNSGVCSSYGIVMYSQDTVYLTGSVYSSLHGEAYAGGYSDMFLMKYSTNGTRLWTRLVGDADRDEGYAVSVDVSSGDVYVVGSLFGSIDNEAHVGDMDVIVMKYSSSGDRQWTRMLGSKAPDEARAVAVDGSGAIFVAGTFADRFDDQSIVNANNIFLAKYLSDGTLVWLKQLGNTGWDFCYGVALSNSSDTIYLAGSTDANLYGLNNAGSYDIFLSSYATTIQPSSQPSSQPSMQPTAQPSIRTPVCRHRKFVVVDSQAAFWRRQCLY